MGPYPEAPVGPTGPHPQPHPIPGGPLSSTAPSTGHHPGPHPIPGGHAFESEVGEEVCEYHDDCQTVGFGCHKQKCVVWPKDELVWLKEIKKNLKNGNGKWKSAVGSNKSLVHGSKRAAVGHGSNKSLGQHGSNTESEKRREEEERRSLESFQSLFESEDSKIPQEVVDQMDLIEFGKKLGPLVSNKSLGPHVSNKSLGPNGSNTSLGLNGSNKSLGHGEEFEKICNQIKLVAEKKNDGKAEKLFPYCFGSIGKKKKH